MDSNMKLGLPDFIYQLLVSKSVERDTKLEYKFCGVGDSVEVTLRWTARGSKWEQPFGSKGKYKSPASRQRDMNRKKWLTVNKNSVAVSTDDKYDKHEQPESESVFPSKSNSPPPISTPKSTMKKITKRKTRQTIPERGHSMALRSGQDAIEQKRNYSTDSEHGFMCSPLSVASEDTDMTGSLRHVSHCADSPSQVAPWSVKSDSINMNPHGDDLSVLSESSDGSDTDTSCASGDIGGLGKCGLSKCEYGPSVDLTSDKPKQYWKCVKPDCGWTICDGCYLKGAHQRHKRWLELTECG